MTTPTAPAPVLSPRIEALERARALIATGTAPAAACEQALAAVPACRLSRDQLKGLIVPPVFYGFGRTATAEEK